MKHDSYTKVILTVIAACLTILVLQTVNTLPGAYASTIPGQTSPGAGFIAVPVNADGSITVRLSPSETLNINIKEISTSDELDVNIDEVGGNFLYNTVPVEIKD